MAISSCGLPLVEEEDVSVASSEEAELGRVLLVSEEDRVGGEEGMSAQESILSRVLEVGNNCHFLGVTGWNRVLLLQLSIVAHIHTVVVIVGISEDAGCSRLIRLEIGRQNVPIRLENRVRGLVLGSDHLHSDETTGDVGVLDDLDVAVVNLLERHGLVQLSVVIIDEVVNELVRREARLLLHGEVLVKEQFLALLLVQLALEGLASHIVHHCDSLRHVLEVHDQKDLGEFIVVDLLDHSAAQVVVKFGPEIYRVLIIHQNDLQEGPLVLLGQIRPEAHHLKLSQIEYEHLLELALLRRRELPILGQLENFLVVGLG